MYLLMFTMPFRQKGATYGDNNKKVYEFRRNSLIFFLSFLNLHNQFDYDKNRMCLFTWFILECVSCLWMCHDDDDKYWKRFETISFIHIPIYMTTNYCWLPWVMYICTPLFRLVTLIGSIHLYITCVMIFHDVAIK